MAHTLQKATVLLQAVPSLVKILEAMIADELGDPPRTSRRWRRPADFWSSSPPRSSSPATEHQLENSERMCAKLTGVVNVLRKDGRRGRKGAQRGPSPL